MNRNTTKITNFYSLSDKVGQGMYGSVYRAKHKPSGSLRAVKMSEAKNARALEVLKREIAIMKVADHPNVVRLYETFEGPKVTCMVMELCHGRNLMDHILKAGHFGEVDAATVMRDMFRAIGYLHGQGIAHRDLKPDNFLLATKDKLSKNVLKLIDFGLSNWIPANGKPLTTCVGTPFYVAPEVLRKSYGPQCDLWSTGAIMFVLLSGSPPFYSKTVDEIFSKVRKGTFSYSLPIWGTVSSEAKDLINNLLVKKPEDRYTPAQALNHTWIMDSAPTATNVCLKDGFMERLGHLRSQNKLTKAVLQIIAGQLCDGKLQLLRDAFLTLDSNGDGILNVAELKAALVESGVNTDSGLDDILDGFDDDCSGKIDYTEFLAAFLDRETILRKDRLCNAFSILDRNGDGLLSRDELRRLLMGGREPIRLTSAEEDSELSNILSHVAKCESELSQLMKEADLNGDGSVDLEEFKTLLESSTSVGSTSCFAYSEQLSETMMLRHPTGNSSFGGSPPAVEMC